MTTTVTMTGPGATTIVDDTALAITAQTIAIKEIAGSTEIPASLLAILSQMNTNLTKIADAAHDTQKRVSDLNAAIGTMATAVSNSASMQTIAAANQISVNNFQMQVTKDALVRADLPIPTMPPIKEQVETAIKEASVLSTSAITTGFITDQIKAMVAAAGTWIAGTETYQTITAWLKSAKDTILSPFIASPSSEKSKAMAGDFTSMGNS